MGGGWGLGKNELIFDQTKQENRRSKFITRSKERFGSNRSQTSEETVFDWRGDSQPCTPWLAR